MNDKQKLTLRIIVIQGKIANTYDSVDMDSDIEDLLDNIVSELDEMVNIVSTMKLAED